ncbi:MAG: hypothetical protein ACTHU0_30735 [Kofleriaceae bacterium]
MIRRFKRATKRRPRLTFAQLRHRFLYAMRPLARRDRRRLHAFYDLRGYHA